MALLVLAACAPHTVPRPRQSTQGIYHTVRPGENLYRIGKAYGLSHEELARVNRIGNVSQVRVGQRIFIPGASQPLSVEIITPAEPPPAVPVPESDRLDANAFLWPVNGVINSSFGRRGQSFHDGVDIAAPEGAPIRSVHDGEVIYSDKLRGYGNIIIIRHAEGVVSVYAHNEVNLVREGQSVRRGEVIARVGSTGRVTGPHLHFEIRKNNAAEDPLRYLPQLCCLAASDIVP
jgi:murein DD-endopeptidase MepM/ murein hydrolase activator NlpD